MARSSLLWFLAIVFLLPGFSLAATGFDLVGPHLDVRVTRDGKTLPIAEVPDLKGGDRLWLHPDFPGQQAARYLLIAAFLRGSTNPPPDSWFFRAETWDRRVREEGLYVVVPADAEQVLLFLAPETGGGFSTLRTNVRARPGAFVRASQDLNQASLDRSRLDAYLRVITEVSETDPEALKDKTKLLARSLNLQVDSNCFEKPANQQLACLMQNENAIVLDDGHTQSMVAALTSGASADLIGQLSATPMAGAGAFSPYVGAIVDVVRIMDGIHTAQYQYIPALVKTDRDDLQLKLNNPPSFINPKSVLTVGLPAVEPPQLPPMRSVHSTQVYCAETPGLVLPVDGAPLVYSTQLGHDFALRVPQKKGAALDLPARADAARGGFVVDTHSVEVASLNPEATGVLRGYWGFEPFDGPSFHLQSAHPEKWEMPAADKNALVAGREDTVHLQGGGAACVDRISLKDRQGKMVDAVYKLVKPDELEVKLPLQDAIPGAATLLIKQVGLPLADQIPVETYSQAARVDAFTFHAGDQRGELTGARLDEVLRLQVKGVVFSSGDLKRSGDQDALTLVAAGAVTGLKTGERLVARVTLRDGRQLELPTTVQPPRPKVTLIGKNVEQDLSASPSPIHLTNPDELPQDGTLTFVLRSDIPETWTRAEKIEVATADDSFHLQLSVEDGSLTLQDAKTVLARLNPLKGFGPSAFGPLRFRPVDGGGAAGDWQPLGNLVRIPLLKNVQCPASPNLPCTLNGSDLFLLDSVSASSTFRISVPVPVGSAGSSLSVPRPIGTVLYIRLRDDPTAVNMIALPVLPE